MKIALRWLVLLGLIFLLVFMVVHDDEEGESQARPGMTPLAETQVKEPAELPEARVGAEPSPSPGIVPVERQATVNFNQLAEREKQRPAPATTPSAAPEPVHVPPPIPPPERRH